MIEETWVFHKTRKISSHRSWLDEMTQCSGSLGAMYLYKSPNFDFRSAAWTYFDSYQNGETSISALQRHEKVHSFHILEGGLF